MNTQCNGSGARAYLSVALAVILCLSLPSWLQGSSGAGTQIDDADETLEWLDNYESALGLAKETGKPLLVEFRCAP